MSASLRGKNHVGWKEFSPSVGIHDNSWCGCRDYVDADKILPSLTVRPVSGLSDGERDLSAVILTEARSEVYSTDDWPGLRASSCC